MAKWPTLGVGRTAPDSSERGSQLSEPQDPSSSTNRKRAPQHHSLRSRLTLANSVKAVHVDTDGTTWH